MFQKQHKDKAEKLKKQLIFKKNETIF